MDMAVLTPLVLIITSPMYVLLPIVALVALSFALERSSAQRGPKHLGRRL